MYVLYALKLKLRLRRNPVSKSFLLCKQAIHQGSQIQISPRAKRELKTNMPHYDADATKAVPEPY